MTSLEIAADRLKSGRTEPLTLSITRRTDGLLLWRRVGSVLERDLASLLYVGITSNRHGYRSSAMVSFT